MNVTGLRRAAAPLLLLVQILSGCGLFTAERVTFDQQGVRIGVEEDPTVTRAEPPAYNNHPADLTVQDIRSLLRLIQVSGWSGTLVGILETPRPVPLVTEEQLATISAPLVAAFREVKPTERVFFSLPKPDVTYSEDRTEGALFIRGQYLHVVVTDHSSFIRADTGGGEVKDVRDTKGMKLWVAGSAHATLVRDDEAPRWAPFETVHISLNIREIMEQASKIAPTTSAGTLVAPSQGSSHSLQRGVPQEDLRLQLRELTRSNLDLHRRLDEQVKRAQTLVEELEQLRQELEKAKMKRQPPRKPLGQ